MIHEALAHWPYFVAALVLSGLGTFFLMSKQHLCPNCKAVMNPTTKFDIHQCPKCGYTQDFKQTKV